MLKSLIKILQDAENSHLNERPVYDVGATVNLGGDEEADHLEILHHPHSNIE